MQTNTPPRAEFLPIEKLHPFENHPFQVKDDAEMDQLVFSVLTQGLLTPIVVRATETDEYEVISGHRRLRACQKAGIETVPALIYSMDRDAAIIVLVDSNLHREHLLPSEKAFAYKMKMEAMSHQGTSSQLGTKLRTDELIAQQSGESRNQIQRYVRLTYLIPEILQMVDETDGIRAAGFAGGDGKRGLHALAFPVPAAEKVKPVRSAGHGSDFGAVAAAQSQSGRKTAVRSERHPPLLPQELYNRENSENNSAITGKI